MSNTETELRGKVAEWKLECDANIRGAVRARRWRWPVIAVMSVAPLILAYYSFYKDNTKAAILFLVFTVVMTFVVYDAFKEYITTCRSLKRVAGGAKMRCERWLREYLQQKH